MNKIKTIRINYYILLSVLIHLSFFLFVEKEKDISLGKKIIPIELIDNFQEAGLGEATKRSEKLIKQLKLVSFRQSRPRNKIQQDEN